MSIFKDTIENLRGYSVAMYSTWLYHKPSRVLFDAGEGVCLAMKNYIFGVDKVFLSHGHYDHIGGLVGMIYTRAAARGDKEKPLTVYYPKGCGQVEALREFVSGSIGHIRYELNWVEMEPGDSVPVGKNLSVQAFKVEHSGLCLGYKLVESRKRLKPELDGKTNEEIEAIAKEQGSDAVREYYERIMLAYCGDSAPVGPSSVEGAEVLIHEATFLEAEDRRGNNHSSVQEAIQVAKEAGAQALILIHISGRYPRQDIEKKIQDAAREVGWEKPLAVFIERKLGNGSV